MFLYFWFHLSEIFLCRTEMMLYLQERSPTGTTRRIPASDVYKVVTSNANIKQQLSNLCVENLITKLAFDQEQLQQYLDNPPAGNYH